MAKTDRDPRYMQETFGTNSLITDYGETPSLHSHETATLETIIEELENIMETGSLDTKMFRVTQSIYPKLKTLQKQK